MGLDNTQISELAADLKNPDTQKQAQADAMAMMVPFLTPEQQLAMSSKPSAGKMGTYNPSDYTVDSWATFAQSQNPADLERFVSPQAAATVESNKLKKQENQLKVNKQRLDQKTTAKNKTEKQKAAVSEANFAIGNIDALLNEKVDLDLIYGSQEWAQPDALRSQQGVNMQARRDQIGSSLQLAAAGKLKGQGTITDSERLMLAEAATLLKNENISPEMAKLELERIRPTFERIINENTPQTPIDFANATDKEIMQYLNNLPKG
jgi:hypothetical protein